MRHWFTTTVLLIASVTRLSAQPSNAPTNSPAVAPPPTGSAIPLPSITVTGATNRGSLTSPPISQVERLKREVPGGFTIQGIDDLNKSRASSLDDLLQNAPGVIMLSENEAEVSKIYIRGYGVIQEDEPSSVEYLLDGLDLNQADGEMIIEDPMLGRSSTPRFTAAGTLCNLAA
jgi:hypothetical protein